MKPKRNFGYCVDKFGRLAKWIEVIENSFPVIKGRIIFSHTRQEDVVLFYTEEGLKK